MGPHGGSPRLVSPANIRSSHALRDPAAALLLQSWSLGPLRASLNFLEVQQPLSKSFMRPCTSYSGGLIPLERLRAPRIKAVGRLNFRRLVHPQLQSGTLDLFLDLDQLRSKIQKLCRSSTPWRHSQWRQPDPNNLLSQRQCLLSFPGPLGTLTKVDLRLLTTTHIPL